MLLEIETIVAGSVDGATLSDGASFLQRVPNENSRSRVETLSSTMPVPQLVFLLVAAFRRHPHINNVFTHISGSSWSRVEQALHVIVDPNASSRDLSPLAQNIVDLMCADRGVTGRIVKPYYRQLLIAALGEAMANRLITHATCLFMESDAAARRSIAPRPATALSVEGMDK